MIPFPCNENRFSFFFFFFCCRRPSTSWPVVYRSQERKEPSIMSESDTMFNERDRRRAAVQLMHSTDPSYDWQKHHQHPQNANLDYHENRNVPTMMKTKFPATIMVFGVVSSEGHIMPPHIFEFDLKVNTKEYLDVLKSVVIPWCNQVAGSRLWVYQQESEPAHKSKRPGLGFVPFSHRSPPPPTWTRWTTSFGHTSRTSPTWHPTTPKPAWSPSIRRAPAGACGKVMLPVPDPYRGADWGWRWLHWIDVSSTT